jgi:hypothetical protein
MMPVPLSRWCTVRFDFHPGNAAAEAIALHCDLVRSADSELEAGHSDYIEYESLPFTGALSYAKFRGDRS